MLERLTSENYPALFKAVQDEAGFRNMVFPDVRIDHSGETRLGKYLRGFDTILIGPIILIEPIATQIFTLQELRALVAHEMCHARQPFPLTDKEARQFELEADQAAVESTDYATIQSYVHKVIKMMAEKADIPEPLKNLSLAFHAVAPNFISENFWLRLDKYHPSPAHRMYAMKKHAQAL